LEKSGSFGYFVLSTQAPGTQVEAFCLTVYGYFGGMDVGPPHPVGVAFGMADVMTELRRFSA
jgi:hypothetical protein